MDYEVPPPPAGAILTGRCVAFVGAGLSAAIVPSWPWLLGRLAEKLGTGMKVDEKGTAFYFEAVGQALQDKAGPHWEQRVREVLDDAYKEAPKEARERVAERCR